LFLKGKIVRKGPLKQKFGADIIKMLDDLKELKNGVFEGYGENTTGHIKIVFGNSLRQKH
jgi:hypothetical protein